MKPFLQITTFRWPTLGIGLSVLWLCLLQNVFAETNTTPDPFLTAVRQNSVYPIINWSNKQTSISRNGLSAIFKMRLRKWNDGTPVTVFVLADDHTLHKKFSKQVLNVFPHQLRRAWNKAVFSGSGQAPIMLESVTDMIEKISTTPGSIGYLSPDDITDDMTDNIKILEIR